MNLSKENLEQLNNQALKLENAKLFGDFISTDNTVGGVFPDGDIENPDIDKFQEK